jgi:hypothetical protein
MAAAQPLTTLSGEPASRLAIGGGPETTQLEPGLLPAARAAGVSFLYWASGDKSPAFAQAFKELAASPSRPELFIAANCRTSPEFVREDVTATLRLSAAAVLRPHFFVCTDRVFRSLGGSGFPGQGQIGFSENRSESGFHIAPRSAQVLAVWSNCAPSGRGPQSAHAAKSPPQSHMSAAPSSPQCSKSW